MVLRELILSYKRGTGLNKEINMLVLRIMLENNCCCDWYTELNGGKLIIRVLSFGSNYIIIEIMGVL